MSNFVEHESTDSANIGCVWLLDGSSMVVYNPLMGGYYSGLYFIKLFA
jgi:hypothetical protein